LRYGGQQVAEDTSEISYLKQVDIAPQSLEDIITKLKDMIGQSVFQGKSDTSSKSISYICFSPSGFEGALESPKPSFWSEKLSHVFASGSIGKVEKPAHKLTTEEKRERAKNYVTSMDTPTVK
jgi:hypothetical protein